jgi:hypothetical protein
MIYLSEAEWGGIMLSLADRLEVEVNQAFIRSALSEAQWSAAQQNGRAMTLEQALTFASESK